MKAASDSGRLAPRLMGGFGFFALFPSCPPRFVWRAHADSARRLSLSLLSKSDMTRAPRPTTTFTRSLQVAVALGQLAPSAQKEKFSRPGRTSFTRAGDIGPNKYGCIVPNVTLQSHCIVQSGPTDSTRNKTRNRSDHGTGFGTARWSRGTTPFCGTAALRGYNRPQATRRL
uniref:Uncharacterized protein n=1 Tax=Oryza sativa subsp. japonica TaxID=39947 RepID=Q6YT04_ORYSJ|nr:hypothetical protein [Oryza sativa Japonica Group]BAD10756.1 hypothetical protein [Oryza sativa Japonica Group]